MAKGLKPSYGVTVITDTGTRIKGPSVPASAENSQADLTHRGSVSHASIQENAAKPKKRSPLKRMSVKEYHESISIQRRGPAQPLTSQTSPTREPSKFNLQKIENESARTSQGNL